MILHLFDDEKIVNRIIKSFETALPQQNIFLCFAESDRPKLVNSHERLFVIKQGDDWDYRIDKEEINAILIHFLDIKKIEFIKKSFKGNIDTFWFMWGADYYNILLHNNGYPLYYEPSYLGFKYFIKRILLKCGFDIERKYLEQNIEFIRNNITHLMTSKIEYDICSKYLGSAFMGKKYIDSFFYYSIDDILGPNLMGKKANGKTILIGNSASFTNNHCYAFKFLKNINLDGRDIVTPLSYGGNPRYKSHIVKKGYEIFGNKYKPLFEFLPLDEYNLLMLRSEVCIYSNWRQEANGNIIIALYLGAKVFLSKKSPLLKKFKSLGIYIFVLENITYLELNTPLTLEQKQKNRIILKEKYSFDRQMDVIKQIWSKY